MAQTKWFERRFDFGGAQNIFPSVLERLKGTPARLEEKMRSIDPSILTSRIGDTWSIQENIGHLSDLETLWQQRFDDIRSGRPELSPTDLQNRRTTEAGHDATPLPELLERFRRLRAQTVSMLEGIDETLVFRSAIHPRLKTPMRTQDLFVFVADHDDHHLARITELARLHRRADAAP